MRFAEILPEHGPQMAAMVIEPVIENLAIVLPDAGYLEGGAGGCATSTACC